MSLFKRNAISAALAGALVWATWAFAENPAKSKDDALDSLLERLESPPGSGPETTGKDGSKSPGDKAKKGSESVVGPDGQPIGGSSRRGASESTAAPGEVAPKDKALDSLLEKLGETEETPAPDDRPKGARGSSGGNPPTRGGDAPKDNLKKQEKDLDRHLEELTGRKTRKRDEDEEGSGPLSEVIKEMRDVEKRLGKSEPDTGEETRKKQAEIVRRLDTLIEQLRNSQNQSQNRRRMLVMRPGRPESRPGENAGAQGGNAPFVRPKSPTSSKSSAGGKAEWGHLPPELRQELENVSKEEELPAKFELIRRYFLSLDKKYLLRRE